MKIRLSLWTEEEVTKAVKENNTIAKTLRALGKKDYRTIHKYVKLYNLDTSHWTREASYKDKPKPPKRLNEEIFAKDSLADRSLVKRRIIEQNLLNYICQQCHITEWHGKKLSLHLDHINGDPFDNQLENLRFLCPNCHSLTETYCAKKPSVIKNRIVGQIFLCKCGKEKHYDSVDCLNCYNKNKPTKIQWPNDNELIKLVNSTNFWQAGKTLGVSDNAIRKRLKRRNLAHFITSKPER